MANHMQLDGARSEALLCEHLAREHWRSVNLVITTWNVLADAYTDAGRYPDSPPRILAPGARTGDTVATVAASDADVVALQEAEPLLYGALQGALAERWEVLWCPKGRQRPDGCVTAVRRPWRVTAEKRYYYADALGGRASGHVAHIVTLAKNGAELTLANTHFRWAESGTPPEAHVGVRQARLLVAELVGAGPVRVIVGDANDRPGGPVRSALAEAGYVEVQPDAPTALVNVADAAALDIIAIFGGSGDGRPVPPVASPMPGPTHPSDHVPVTAELRW
jgi:endonuclease/exonuclease/phosphatase family metal-dependent hydrolase